MNDFGFTHEINEKILQILKKYQAIKKAVIFGSRAKNTFTIGSDVDLAIWQGQDEKLDNNVIAELKSDFEESNLPYFFDVLDYKKISNEKLKKEIDNYGKIFYLKDWLETTLGEVCEINPTESLPKGKLAKSVPMDCIDSFTRQISRFEEKEFKGGMKFRNGDTLLARITPCLENGKTAYVDFLDKNEIGFGSTEYIVIREKQELSNKKFLYYLAISPRFREIAIKAMTGTSGRQRVQTDVLVNKTFLLPPLPEQIAIASVLSAFDDKIELLRDQNKTLEEMGQVIFAEMCLPPNPLIGMCLPPNPLVGGTEQVISKEMCLPPNPLIGGTEEDNSLKEKIEQVVFAEMCLPPNPLIGGTEGDNSLKEKIEQDKKYENWKLNLSQEEVKEKGLIWDGKHFPYNPNNLEKAKMMRRNPTQAEQKLWDEFLSRHDYKFYRQRPIDHFIADFYCSKADLIIEVDGDVHLSDASKEYDRMRTELFNTYGLKVIRFSNEEVINSFKNVCQKINEYLKPFNLQKAPFQEVEIVQNFPEKELEIVQAPPMRGLGGNLPEGWRVGKLGEVGQIVCGKTPSKDNQEYFGGEIPFIKIPDMHGQVFIVKTEDSLTELGANTQKNKFIPKNSICVSCIATVGLVSITSKDSQTNQQINSIVPNDEKYLGYLYFVLTNMKSDLLAIGSGGSATLNINTSTFSNIEIIIPNEGILENFHDATNPIFTKILDNLYQIQSLARSRDELLPRLMLGEVQVSKP